MCHEVIRSGPRIGIYGPRYFTNRVWLSAVDIGSAHHVIPFHKFTEFEITSALYIVAIYNGQLAIPRDVSMSIDVDLLYGYNRLAVKRSYSNSKDEFTANMTANLFSGIAFVNNCCEFNPVLDMKYYGESTDLVCDFDDLIRF